MNIVKSDVKLDSETASRPELVATSSPTNRLRRWLGRSLLGLLLVLVLLGAAGALYQSVATARDARDFPPPGQVVEVDGYQMHIDCLGQGSPTVILESALAGTTSMWAWVQPDVATATRLCAYDRAGSGWSDSRPEPRDAQHVVAELHALLATAEIPGPYVLVGHSYGGKYVRLFAAQHPDEVAGVVLVDASHPEQWTRTAEGQSKFQTFARLNSVAPFLARLGLLRLANYFPANPDLPSQQSAELKAFTNSTRFADINAAEFGATLETDEQVRAAGNLGDLPLVVVTATDHGYAAAAAAQAPQAQLDQLQAEEQLWQVFQVELAALSSNSVQHVVPGADHASLLTKEKDAQATIAAILEVIEAVRSGRPLLTASAK